MVIPHTPQTAWWDLTEVALFLFDRLKKPETVIKKYLQSLEAVERFIG